MIQIALAMVGLLAAFRVQLDWSNNFYFEQVVIEPAGLLLPVPMVDREVIRTDGLPPPEPPPRIRRAQAPVPLPEPEPVPAVWEPPVPIRQPGITGKVFVLSQEYAWVRGERGDAAGDARIEYYGETHPLSVIDDYLRLPGLQEQIRQSTDVIAVGLASCEGNHREEHERAATRAEALAARLRAVYPPGRTLGSLQLWDWSWGRFGADCPGASASATRGQRRIVVVALRRDPGVVLRAEELRRGMEESEALRVRPSDYPFPGRLRSVHH